MIKSILIAAIFILTASIGFAATYYIDNTYGNDANAGNSAAGAWKTIAKVNETSFSPGDQILFKRNGSWYETLNISSSGTHGAPITFSSYGTGNLPVIDASLVRQNCVYLHTQDYITIREFAFRNATGAGALRIMYGTGIEVSDNEIFVTGHGGVFIENSLNVIVTGNNITTPDGILDQQTDGIYSQNNNNNLYEKNNIVITNSHPTQHIDGIQSFMDGNLIIRDNTIIQQNTKTNSQGIYTTSGSGEHKYYNNVVYCPNTVASIVGFKNLNIGTASLKLYHNTLIGKGGNIVQLSGNPELDIRNNIFMALSTNYLIINIEAILSNAVLSNNLYFNGGHPSIIYYSGIGVSLDQWKSFGFDVNSFVDDPHLTENYSLRANSPAIKKGIFLGPEFAFDKAGNLRNEGGGVDLGAYETQTISSVNEKVSMVELPENPELLQNYPNPFNPSTVIKYSLPSETSVLLKIFDISGAEVQTLIDEKQPQGVYSVNFNASELASGIYIYQLQAGSFNQTKKMTFLK